MAKKLLLILIIINVKCFFFAKSAWVVENESNQVWELNSAMV